MRRKNGVKKKRYFSDQTKKKPYPQGSFFIFSHSWGGGVTVFTFPTTFPFTPAGSTTQAEF